jgi:predicted lipoprotein with Yx(FWY)xxD motif
MTGGRKSTRGRRAIAALIIVAALGGGLFLTSAASAQTGRANKPVKVVKEVMRSTYGSILVNNKSHALYVDTNSTPCAEVQGCLTIWPPLLMPKGKTMPAGASGLGTTPFGSGQLQVTYNSEPLYTFYQDNKKSVNGENVGGFVVAQVAG